ncbi:MAG: hypothetical protein WC829_00305 [Hyphomicrobium sp.]|jgi:nucleoside phosphorylase
MYDDISTCFPLYDIRVFFAFLRMANMECATKPRMISFVHKAAEDHATASHAIFVEAWDQLLRSMGNVGATLGREPRVGSLTAEIGRRASRAQKRQIETLSYDQLAEFANELSLRGLPGDAAPVSAAKPSGKVAVIMVATDREWTALRDVAQAEGLSMEPVRIRNLAAWRLGLYGGRDLYVVRCEMGLLSSGASILTADEVIRKFDPVFVLMPGIAFGIKPDDQKLGDVLVATALIDYETVKLSPGTYHERGSKLGPSVELLSRARVAGAGRSDVHFGSVLSGCKLVNDKDFVDELKHRFPEALGGEMEGVGLASASHRHQTHWLMTKAICDWGFGKDDKAQALAAQKACAFCLEIAKTAVFD